MNAKKAVMGTDFAKLDDHVISPEEYDELPELTDADLARGKWKVGGKRVSEAAGRAAFSAALKKQKINIMLDPDVLAWFREQAGGRGYQTLINATLREAMRQKTMEDALRRVIREELHPA
jgi:uncharacterized protein (DUF4415 family)